MADVPGPALLRPEPARFAQESIIIDYFYTDEIPGYRERPDFLAGRRGLQVRDEIRMVRPGFYLGRAYIGKIFFSTSRSITKKSPIATAARLPKAAKSTKTAGRERSSGPY